MLYEFAVDPECVPTLDSLRRITDQCGLHLGRFIANFARRRWEFEIRDKLKPQTFRDDQQLTDLLIQLQRRGGLFKTDRYFESNEPWLENALNEHRKEPFRAIIAGCNPAQADFILLVEDITPETERWSVPTEIRALRTVAGLTACVKPLLRISQDVLFVDPYFNPDRARYREALEAFLAVACEGGRKLRRLEYHTRPKIADNPPDREKQIGMFCRNCHDFIPKHVPKDARLTIFLWEEKPDGEEMHARYVMTEWGAIRIDTGLDVRDAKSTTDVGLVDPWLYRGRWNDFQRTATTYKLVDTIEIVGTRPS